jgi:methyl-accepting chemotaxis protein
MGEITGALEQIEEAATLANDDAVKNAEVGQNSVSMIEEVNNTIVDVKNRVSEISKKVVDISKQLEELTSFTGESVEKGVVTTNEMNDVEKQVKQVGKILRVIENTIIQTTMLAVSGSIEAARAGEFGKGFAVVSSDIRNLAQEAKSSLEKINDILDGLDSETNFMVVEWAKNIDTQDKEKFQIASISQQLNELLREIKEVENALDGMYQANLQNAEALKQALQGAEQIQQAAELTQNNAGESKSAAELIQTTVAEIGEMVEELAVLADELQG